MALRPQGTADPPARHVRSLHMAGRGLPFYVPAAWPEAEWVDEVLTAADGILLTGGGDVCPSYYGTEEAAALQYPSPTRDELEGGLVRRAMDAGVPLLGICRGCQVINVAWGGSLVQDVPSMRASTVPHAFEPGPDKEHEPVHEISVTNGSRVASAYEATLIDANSMHLQAIRDVGEGLVVTAVAPDGVIEAIELPDRWIVGVQWHPERMADAYPEHLALFGALVETARKSERWD